jgi:hypothetical protein
MISPQASAYLDQVRTEMARAPWARNRTTLQVHIATVRDGLMDSFPDLTSEQLGQVALVISGIIKSTYEVNETSVTIGAAVSLVAQVGYTMTWPEAD